MTAKLKALTITNLRGATQPFTLAFDSGKTMTLVYGENGTGKSTVCDAFQFIGGSLTSLDDRGLGKTARYWPSMGKTQADVSVVLETSGGAVTAALVKGDIAVSPSGLRPRVEILRRREISKLVEANPADRYTAIKRFVDVSGIEASEASLRQLAITLKAERDTAVVQVSENDALIKAVWEQNGSLLGDPVVWARAHAKQVTAHGPKEAVALVRLETLYNDLALYPKRVQAAGDAVLAAEAAATKDQSQVIEVAGTLAESSHELLGVLKAVESFLAGSPSTSTCPACESSEKSTGLRDRIAERLGALKGLESAKQQVSTSVKEVERAKAAAQHVATQLADAAGLFVAQRDSRQWAPEIVMPPGDPLPSSLEGWLSEAAPFVAAWRQVESERAGKQQFVAALESALKLLDENSARATQAGNLLPRVERAHEIVMEERRNFTDEVLSQIATEVGRLYELVHPGEGLNKVSLELDPKRRASLDLATEFMGNESPPQAYFSDSHLDTLGLCLFLAIAALDTADQTVLVLDDVLASVDEPHVERLIEMVYAETQRFQHCVLTTHYRPWKEKLRWGWLRHGECQFVELAAWSSATGLVTVRTPPEVERLKALMAATPPDVQSVCAKAGVILESALEFLTLLYQCKVPRRPGSRYTLGDLLPAIDKKLRKALAVDKLIGSGAAGAPSNYQTIQLGPILDELTRVAQIRNVMGCHFSELSSLVLDVDGIGFATQVLTLIETLMDEDVGWPRSDKSGTHWATSSDTRRLRPLQQPS